VSVGKYLLSTAVLAIAASGAAQAADLGGMKDVGPAPIITNIFDGAAPGTMTVAGITVYGAIDASLVYQSHGAPANGYYYLGGQYMVAKNNAGARFDFSNNAMQQSLVGLKANQSLYDLFGHDALAGWSFVSDVQIGFDPSFADIADACRTLRMNNGLGGTPPVTWSGDGSRCGQIFNGEAYGGLKHSVFGQLTYGRHNSVLLSALGAYDPEAGSYANSLFAYSGTFGGGGGATEDARWNNSLKYSNTIGMFRVAGMYRFDGFNQGSNAYSVGGGIDLPGELKGLSIDGVWAHFNDAITSAALSSGNCGSLGVSIATCQQLNILSGTVQDTEAWAVMAKYNFEHFGHKEVTIMGGYEHINNSNPSDGGAAVPVGYSTIGDYALGFINNSNFVTSENRQVYWLGGKWAITDKLTAAGAWYHIDQDAFVAKAGACNGKSGTAASSNCAGSFDWASASLDYQWTKRLDVYAGISYTEAHDGMASGFTVTNTWNPTVGARFRF
jgi:predicted porin